MRLAPILIVLLLAPMAAAQPTPTDAGPTLSLKPSVLDVAPSGQAEATALISNPLSRELLLNLTAQPSEGVKARVDKPQVRIPPGGSATVHITALVPNATGVKHTVEVFAREPPAPRATAALESIHLNATLEIRVLAGAKPAPQLPPLELVVTPASIDVPINGSASGTLRVRNLGREPVPLHLKQELPPGITLELAATPAAIQGGGAVDIVFTVHATGDARGPLRAAFIIQEMPRANAPFEIHVVEPAAAAAGVPTAIDEGALIAGAVVAGAAGTWTALWLTRRQWWPLLLALYTRLRPSSILDHPVRRRIAELVQQHPGISFGELARLADIAPGQLTHHARMLEKAGVVFSSPDGQTRRFFHVGGGRLASVAPLSERVLSSLRENPRRASELARELGVSRQALHYHVKQLAAQGKLTARADGREMWLEAVIPPQGQSGGASLRAST